MLCRALLALPRWVASGGRDFTFYHAHPGLSMGSEEADANFASVICNNFQWATLLAAEQVMLPSATSPPVSLPLQLHLCALAKHCKPQDATKSLRSVNSLLAALSHAIMVSGQSARQPGLA